jgi:hypothetical protein
MLARLLKKAKVGLHFNEHITVRGDIVLRTPSSSAWRASFRKSWVRISLVPLAGLVEV